MLSPKANPRHLQFKVDGVVKVLQYCIDSTTQCNTALQHDRLPFVCLELTVEQFSPGGLKFQ